MKLSDNVYNVLKWVVLVCLPALTTAYVGLDAVFKWGYADTVAKVSAIVCTLIGTLIGISTAEYNRSKKEL